MVTDLWGVAYGVVFVAGLFGVGRALAHGLKPLGVGRVVVTALSTIGSGTADAVADAGGLEHVRSHRRRDR